VVKVAWGIFRNAEEVRRLPEIEILSKFLVCVRLYFSLKYEIQQDKASYERSSKFVSDIKR